MDWELICDVLEPFGIREMRRGDFKAAARLLLLDERAADLPGSLYLTAGTGGGAGPYRFALIVSAGPSQVAAENYIELAPAPLAAVHNALAQTKTDLDMLDNVLSQMVTDQEIVDAAGMYLNLPMFYLDESYRILAMTQNVAFETDEEWRHMDSKGFLSPESTLRMKESGDLDMLAAADRAVIYRSAFFPYPSVDVNITSEGRFLGRLNLLCIRGETPQYLVAASDVIAAHLRRNALRGVRKPAGGPFLRMLTDLLSGVALSEALISDRLRHLPAWSSGLLRVLTVHVETKRDEQVGPYYLQLVERLGLGSRIMALMHDERLVVVLHGADEAGLDELTQRLLEFCQSQHLSGGMSNRFSRLRALADHYRQAETAWTLGMGQGVRFYQECMLAHILSYIPAERTAFLISPDVIRLMEADARDNLSLSDTLRAYLACGCNLTRTAEALFVHKNTMLYRLNRIRSIIRCDLNDGDDRLLLELSYKLLERQAAGTAP